MSRESANKWYREHREAALARNKEWCKKNRERRADYRREYYKTPQGKVAVKKAIAKYEKSHPERKVAWVRARSITKDICVVCGDPNTHKHHPDPTEPMIVISLCPLHHKAEHKKNGV